MKRLPTPSHWVSFEARSVALFAACALSVAAAQAQSTPRPRTPDVFVQADVSGDGALDRQEAKRLPAVAARFDEFDADHNGLLSRKELGL